MSQKEINNLLWIGTVVNTHGIKGEVRVLSDSDDKDNIFAAGKEIFYELKGEVKTLVISTSRPHKNFMLLTFDGITDINQIEWLKTHKVYIEKEILEDDEYYINDLIGLPIYNQGELIGTIKSILDQGPYDSLVVEIDENKTTNIPFVDEFEIEFIKEEKKVSVRLPEGYFE